MCNTLFTCTRSIPLAQILFPFNLQAHRIMTYGVEPWLSLTSKNKQGFVDESCKKDSLNSTLHTLWDRCNALVLSWIVNSVSKELVSRILYSRSAHSVWMDFKERFDKINGPRVYLLHQKISTLKQGTSSTASYFTHLKMLWEEYSSIVEQDLCGCPKNKNYLRNRRIKGCFNF